MRLKIRYAGPVASTLKRREEIVDMDAGSTLRDLLEKLVDSHGKWLKDEVLDDDTKQIRDGALVVVNGISVARLEGLNTQLKEGDNVALLPWFPGGG